MAALGAALGSGRDVVPDRVLGDIAVVEIAQALVPIVAVEPVQVDTGDERVVSLHGHLDLECEGGVLESVVFGGFAPVDGEHRDRPNVHRAFDCSHLGRAHQALDGQPSAVWHVEGLCPAVRRDGGEIDRHLFGARLSLPRRKPELRPRRLGIFRLVTLAGVPVFVGVEHWRVVAPRERDVQVGAFFVDQHAEPDR